MDGRMKDIVMLIVDDVDINREILGAMFTDSYEIVEAADGLEALNIIKERNDISIILLDVVMPGMNGIEFMENIRQMPEYSDIPIVVNTQAGEQANEIRALELGAADFITKPYNAEIVRRRISNIVEKNILEKQKMKMSLKETSDRLDSIINTVPGGIATFRVGKRVDTLFFNDGICDLFGYSRAELADKGSKNLFDLIHDDDRMRIIRSVEKHVKDGSKIKHTFKLKTNKDETVWVTLNAEKYAEKNGHPIYNAVFTDATKEKLREEQLKESMGKLKFRAEHDWLTGIYNGETFYKATLDMINTDNINKYEISVWNIERFKVINDLFGNEAGDSLLKQMSAYLSRVYKNKGTYGRLSADHFAACSRCGEIKYNEVISDLMDLLSERFAVTVDCGIYRIEDEVVPVSVMCDRALMAVQIIKGNYLNHFAYYDGELRAAYISEQEIISEMHSALLNEQFFINLQPIYNAETGVPVSAEALVRWKHPVKGIMPPSTFIPVFEKNGFITEIDKYVLIKVCKLIRKMLDENERIVPISVNLSRMNFYDQNLCNDIMDVINKYGLEPWMIHIEITESAYTDNPKQLIDMMETFRKNEFEILMDDFGSGYSSLNMLKDVPVDILKIDMKFMDNLETSARADNILISIIKMAKLLNMKVIAEGVETKAQYEFLKHVGCDDIQGYYFSKPVDVDTYVRKIASIKKNGVVTFINKKLKIIVVADDEINRRTIKSTLMDTYDVIEACNEDEMMLKTGFKGLFVDLIIADITGKKDGNLSLMKKLRTNPMFSHIPVIVAADAEDRNSEIKALDYGAVDVIKKPVSAEVIKRRIRNTVRLVEIEKLHTELYTMTKLSERDSLTKLYNRAAFEKIVSSYMKTGKTMNLISAFVIVDIDNLKIINDTMGHSIGDKVITEVSKRLRKAFRSEDAAGRLGGDEFGVFVKNSSSTEVIVERVKKLVKKLNFEVSNGTADFIVTASIGIAFAPEHGTSFMSLYKHADSALYVSKRTGRNKYTIYKEGCETNVR